MGSLKKTIHQQEIHQKSTMEGGTKTKTGIRNQEIVNLL